MLLDDTITTSEKKPPANHQIEDFLEFACLSSNLINDPTIARFCEDELIKAFTQFGYNQEVSALNLLVAGSDMPRGKVLKALVAAKNSKVRRLQEQMSSGNGLGTPPNAKSSRGTGRG